MDIRDILKSFDQLTEGESTVHKAGPGGYGNKHGSEDVTDQYGKPIGRMSLGKLGAQNEPKRGKGRPPNPDKAQSYDSSALSKAMGMGKAPKPTGKPSVKHSLKEYFDQMDESMLNQLRDRGNVVTGQKQQDRKNFDPNTGAALKPNSTISGIRARMQNKPSQSVEEAGLAVQPMPATPQQQQQKAVAAKPSFMIKDPANPNMPAITTQDPAVVQAAKNGTMSMQKPGAAPTTQPVPGATPATGAGSQVAPMKETGDVGKHNNATTGFDALVRKLTPKYGKEAATKIAGAQLKKMSEAEAPQHFAQSSPLSTANRGVLESKKGVNPFAKKDDKTAKKDDKAETIGKKVTKDIEKDEKKGAAPKKGVNPFAKKEVKEAAKPDFLDLDKDGNKKESMKTAAKDKKKVKEGMEHHLQAARLEGKSHALRKMPYNCTHDDMEEARCYHDGFKEGLDECYGQMPILGRTAVDEVSPEVGTMASYGAHDEMDEGNAFTAGLAKTPHGGKFKVGGSTFTDRTRYDSNLDEFAFESLDKQLNSLLESEEKVSEGMTVSISKGQQGSPDSVSVSAQDGEADQLLSIIKSAGMGLFGGEEQGFNAPQGTAGAHGGISVVDDHDGMMALMKKLSGGEMQSGGDYADEEGHMHGEEGHSHEGEEPCNECGMMECGCEPSGEEQVVDEVESEDQMAYNVAEDNPPDNGSANSTNATQGNDAANQALATADAGEEEEAVDESDEDETGEEAGEEDEEKDFFHNPRVPADKQLKAPPKEVNIEESFSNLYKKLALLSEESTSEKDDKAEKAAKKVAKDIEYDEGHKGKDDDKAEEAGKKVKKDIEYDDKKDKKKIDEWANEAGKNGTDASFEADIDFMTKVISGGLNKQKSTGQTTIPVINGQKSRMGVDGLGNPMKESTDLLRDYKKLSGL
jgi:hypothetical protein